jgi:hypothetical protein
VTGIQKKIHRKAAWRAKRNKIKMLKKENGQFTVDGRRWNGRRRAIAKNCTARTRTYVQESYWSCFLLHVEITPEMNDVFCHIFSDQETADALFQIEPLKAPVRLSSVVHKFFDTIAAVRKKNYTGCMPEGVNDTAILLIPKSNNPEGLKDF